MSPESQSVLITGASSGIGAEIARKFAKQGYALLLFGRDEKRLEKIKSECGSKYVEYLAFDLADVENQKQSILKKLENLPQPTILINNAGIFHNGLLNDTSTDNWQTMFQVNLLSAVQLTQIMWPIFKKNYKGSVLNISSTLGLKPTATTGAYSAIKAAMINWTQSLAMEGGEFHIRANCICPGIVDTPIHTFYHLPENEKAAAMKQMATFQLLHELGKPVDIAEAAFFLATDISKWTTGAVLSVDGGINLK